MSLVTPKPRRTILQFGLVAASAAVTPHAFAQAARDKARKANESKANDSKVEEVTPPEDLMREHGVLDRVLLIYEAAGRKLDAKEDFDPKVVTDAAAIVRTFIEDYHEKSEEDFIFPRFRKAGQLADLVDTLKTQHDAGRRVTMKISSVAPRSRQDDGARRDLIAAMQAFIVMYRPHAAREDTDLFPKLRAIVSPQEFAAIGEDMEKQEHQHFGDDGFEKTVAQVAALEKTMGIADLRQFTPTG
jgi:hemerythrin-like domain-containing protein